MSLYQFRYRPHSEPSKAVYVYIPYRLTMTGSIPL